MLEKKIRRYKLMDAHRDLVKNGKFIEAREVLRLLRKGSVKLGLSDEEWAVENICSELGCKIRCMRNGDLVEVRL